MRKTQILVYKNWKPVALIHTLNEDYTFTLTKDDLVAKVWDSQAEASAVIDKLSAKYQERGTSFVMYAYRKRCDKRVFERLASEYAKKHGIVKYRVVRNTMIYNVSYPSYLNNPRYTVQHIVNLATEEEQTKQLQRYVADGLVNRH